MVRREPTAPKIQSRLPPRSTRARSWEKFQTWRPHDCSSTKRSFASCQHGSRRSRRAWHDPFQFGRCGLVDIRHRSAIIHKDKEMREVRQVRAWAPQHGVKRCLPPPRSWEHISTTPLPCKCRCQRGKFPVFRLDDLPIIFLPASSGCSRSAVCEYR